MLISIITGGIAVTNAAGFLLLAPGKLLGTYIACSSIFGVALWLTSSILPAAWEFDGERMATLRAAQLWLCVAAAGLLLGTQPVALAAAFCVLLFSETFFFFLAIVIIRSETKLFQRFELTRQIFNSVALIVTATALHASPLGYAWGLAIVSVAGGLVMTVTGLHRPPLGKGRARPREVFVELRRALGSRRLYALLGGRAIEVTSLLTLARLEWLGVMLALKVGLAVSNTLAVNARSRPLELIVAVGAVLYAAGLTAIIVIGHLDRPWVPRTFRFISGFDAALAAPIALACLTLIVIGWRTPETPRLRWRRRKSGITGIAE